MINVLLNPEAFVRTSMYKNLMRVEAYEPMDEIEHAVFSRNLRDDSGFNDVLRDMDEYDIRVGYVFTDNLRNPRRAGRQSYGSEIRFSELFEMLCELNGSDFIKTYFYTCFEDAYKEEILRATRETSDTKYEINEQTSLREQILELGKQQRITKKGEFDRRFKVYKDLTSLLSGYDESTVHFAKDRLANQLDYISLKIKRHIQQCLATGKIPLTFKHKQDTIKKRRRLNLTPIRAFYATGQLIDNIVISYDAVKREGLF